MKTASVRELRNHYADILKWLEAGEEITISRYGKIIGRLIPEKPAASKKVDWTTSAAFRCDKKNLTFLSAQQVAALLDENKGIG